jgi:hypothetical protein
MRVQVQCVTLSGQFAQKLLNLYGENFRRITSTGLEEIQK